MTKFVAIINPLAGGSSYTSLRAASQFVSRGRAEWENGMLRFIDRATQIKREVERNSLYWNGAPSPPSLRRQINFNPGDPMRVPGEVRS